MRGAFILGTVCSLRHRHVACRLEKAKNRTRFLSLRPEGGSCGRSLPACAPPSAVGTCRSEGFGSWSKVSFPLPLESWEGFSFGWLFCHPIGPRFKCDPSSDLYVVRHSSPCRTTPRPQLCRRGKSFLSDFQDDRFTTFLASECLLLRKAGTSCSWHKSQSVRPSLRLTRWVSLRSCSVEVT